MKTRLHRETIREGVAGPGVLENGDEPQGEEEEKEEAKAVNQTFPVRLGRRSLAIKPHECGGKPSSEGREKIVSQQEFPPLGSG